MTTIGYFTIWARPHTDLMLFRQEPCHYKFGIKTLSPISKQKDTLEASRCFILSIWRWRISFYIHVNRLIRLLSANIRREILIEKPALHLQMQISLILKIFSDIWWLTFLHCSSRPECLKVSCHLLRHSFVRSTCLINPSSGTSVEQRCKVVFIFSWNTFLRLAVLKSNAKRASPTVQMTRTHNQSHRTRSWSLWSPRRYWIHRHPSPRRRSNNFYCR